MRNRRKAARGRTPLASAAAAAAAIVLSHRCIPIPVAAAAKKGAAKAKKKGGSPKKKSAKAAQMLSRGDYDDVLSSEVGEELGPADSDLSVVLWGAMEEFEWERAKAPPSGGGGDDGEDAAGDDDEEEIVPVVICNSDGASDGRGRIDAVRRALREAGGGGGGYGDGPLAPLRPVSNTASRTCSIASVGAGVARRAAERDPDGKLGVLLLGSVLKIRHPTIGAVRAGEVEAIHVDLRPRESDDDGSSPQAVWEGILQSLQYHSEEGRPEDDGGRGRMLSPRRRHGLMDSFFWTGVVRSMEKDGQRRGLRSSTTHDRRLGRYLQTHDRAVMWNRALEETSGGGGGRGVDGDDSHPPSPGAAELRRMLGRLVVSTYAAGDGFQIHLRDPPTPGNRGLADEPPHCESCVLTLVAAIAANHHTSSLSYAPPVELGNREANWIVRGYGGPLPGGSASASSSSLADEIDAADGRAELTDEMDPADGQAELTGAGEVVTIADSGMDTDHCYFWDRKNYVNDTKLKAGEIQMDNRVVVQYVSKFGDQLGGKNGHGTHVAGTIAGRKHGDEPGRASGISRAKIAFIDLFHDTNPFLPYRGRLPQEWSEFFELTKRTGSKILNASWGARVNSYKRYDVMVDGYLYDNPFNVMVVACGNLGFFGGNTVGSPGGAKNTISVGSSQSGALDLIPGMKGKDYLSFFSSRGPTEDGRIKPDICAPGHNILSASSIHNQVGECDPPQQPDPRLLGQTWGGLSFMSGSSMAAPVVSGLCALVREYFIEGWYPTGAPDPGNGFEPTSALVKAIFINGAQPLKGIQERDMTVSNISDYDVNGGFGRASLVHSLALHNRNSIKLLACDQMVVSNATASHEVEVSVDTSNGECTATEISVALVWTDPPSVDGCMHCVLNDLDLTLTKNGESDNIYYPNGLVKKDPNNNVERIRANAVQGDTFTVHVHASNLVDESQSYALVVTGCLAQSVSCIAPLPTPQPTPEPTPEPTPQPIASSSSESQSSDPSSESQSSDQEQTSSEYIIEPADDPTIKETEPTQGDTNVLQGRNYMFSQISDPWQANTYEESNAATSESDNDPSRISTSKGGKGKRKTKGTRR